MGIMNWFKKKKVDVVETEEVVKAEVPKKTEREEFIEFIDSYLLSLKLSNPKCDHSIEYLFYDLESSSKKYLKSVDKWSLNMVAIESGYKEHFELVFKYFKGNLGVTIYTIKDEKKYNYILSIRIIDSYMRDIMTDDFKNEIRLMFGRPVFTSKEFTRSDGKGLNYKGEIETTKANLIKENFIKLVKLVENLENESGFLKKNEEDADVYGFFN